MLRHTEKAMRKVSLYPFSVFLSRDVCDIMTPYSIVYSLSTFIAPLLSSGTMSSRGADWE